MTFNLMKTFVLPAAVTALCATAAGATTISISAFDATDFQALVGTAPVEDFENIDTASVDFEAGTPRTAGTTGEVYGEINTLLNTSVGSFTTAGGVGSGSTCGGLSLNGQTCDNIALQYDPSLNGQGNVVPEDGQWALNANDTLGIIWEATLGAGTTFDTIAFVLRDGADQGATLTVTAEGGGTASVMTELSGLGNDNRQLFVVNFTRIQRNSTIRLVNNALNDSFTLDGASLFTNGSGVLPPVPLPAGVWMLLTGLGGLAIVRRRRRATV